MMNRNHSEKVDVLIIGRYFCDLVFSGLPELPRLGHEVYSRELALIAGGAANALIALTRLNLNAIWPCEFGSDPFSQYVKREIIKAGVNSNYFSDAGNPSLRVTVAFSFGNERAFLSYADLQLHPPYAKIIRETSPNWVYITHLLIGSELDQVVSAAAMVHAGVFMDCQAHQLTIGDPHVKKALQSVDIFSPNETEALALTGLPAVESALNALSQYTPLVIVKCGASGCLAKSESVIIQSPSIPVEVKDTTGAGDNFNCGFLYGQIHGHNLEESLRIGNICGGLSTRAAGGSSASPTPEEVKEWLK